MKVKDISLYTGQHTYQQGRNEDGETIYREAYYATFGTAYGERWNHNHTFDNKKEAEALVATIKQAEEIDLNNWQDTGEYTYGSQGWQDYGEAAQIQREREGY